MTGLNAQHARALTFLALEIRAATFGAGPWDEQGTYVNVMKREGQNLAIVAQDVIRHAARVDAKTPGVIASGFTPPEVVEVKARRGNPTRAEECQRHPGQWPEFCAACKTEPITAYNDQGPAEVERSVSLNPNLAAKLAKILEETP